MLCSHLFYSYFHSAVMKSIVPLKHSQCLFLRIKCLDSMRVYLPWMSEHLYYCDEISHARRLNGKTIFLYTLFGLGLVFNLMLDVVHSLFYLMIRNLSTIPEYI